MYYREELLFLDRKYNKMKDAFKKDTQLKIVRDKKSMHVSRGSSVVEQMPEEHRVVSSILTRGIACAVIV